MPTSPFWLTTERLGIRRFTAADLDWFVALRSDPRVMRYGGGPQSREKTEEIFRTRIVEYYDANPGLGIWVTAERSSGVPLGFHLINQMHGESHVQVGFFLQPSAWGQGFGTEMARALVRYGFIELHLAQVVAIAMLENHASQHVLTKIGLRRNGERSFAHPAYVEGNPFAWFERDAADWLAAHGR